MNKRCTNCGKYPFCKDIKNPAIENNCEKWIKIKLINAPEKQKLLN